MLLCAIVIFRLLLSCSVWYLPCVVPQHVVVDIGLTGLYHHVLYWTAKYTEASILCSLLCYVTGYWGAQCYTLPGCWFPCTAAAWGTLLYHVRLPASMLCCSGHTVMPCQVAGFHVWPLCLDCYTVPGCWVPCTAAVCILLYRSRLLGSMYSCGVYTGIQG